MRKCFFVHFHNLEPLKEVDHDLDQGKSSDQAQLPGPDHDIFVDQDSDQVNVQTGIILNIFIVNIF
jgi:hypothetical protein